MLYEAEFNSSPQVNLFVQSIPNLARPKFNEAIQGEFRPVKVGEIFGPSWVIISIILSINLISF